MVKRAQNIAAPQVNEGGLLSDDEARNLSISLCRLGDQWQEICAELEAAGYGLPSAVDRKAIAALAATADERFRLNAYWTEWAKERLAGLVGPIDILRGTYPKCSAYRSVLIAGLRDDFLAGRLSANGPIVSPQVEPTFKRYVERLSDDPAFQQVHEAIKNARQRAAASLLLEDQPAFESLTDGTKYDLLVARYRAVLDRVGFTLDSHRKTGLVFRKITSDKRWAFLLVDESRDRLSTGGLSPSFALTWPGKAVRPSAVSLSAVATFSPNDLVPRFLASCLFARNSYAEFCLAADSIAFLAQTLYARVDQLLSEGCGVSS